LKVPIAMLVAGVVAIDKTAYLRVLDRLALRKGGQARLARPPRVRAGVKAPAASFGQRHPPMDIRDIRPLGHRGDNAFIHSIALRISWLHWHMLARLDSEMTENTGIS